MVFSQDENKNENKFQISEIFNKCDSSSHVEKIFLKINLWAKDANLKLNHIKLINLCKIIHSSEIVVGI